MSLPEELRGAVPGETARTWLLLRDLLPDGAYLGGGTAIALRLRHRVSRDLHFFLQEPTDLEALAARLDRAGNLDVQHFEPAVGRQTLNASFDGTRLQFLEASSLVLVEPLTRIAGVPVAGLGDLLAMKLEVILDRGELRDYFDIVALERDGHRPVEEGLPLALRKYRPRAESAFVASIVRALAYLDDVQDDPALPMPKASIVAYWERRVPELVSALSLS
jgi:Nucleotidyl transferase AbiEii toxin, Type IV TA system